jgi:PAS domain S-box-containing protein
MHDSRPTNPDARVEALERRIAALEEELREARRFEARLQTTDEKLSLALEASGVGLWTWDRVTDHVHWDPRTCAIFRIDPAHAPTSYAAWAARMHPDDLPRLEEHFTQAIASGVYGEIEHRILRGDGTVGWILARGSLHLDEGRELLRVMGGVIDITERKRVEEHLYQAHKMEAVGQLASGIAHNFNNVLAIVLSNVELAAREAPSVTTPLAHAREAALQAVSIVRELMLLSRSQPKFDRKRLDPRQIVRRSVAFCRTTFDRAITLSEEIPATALAIEGHESQIEQCLLNVLINARDAVSGPRDREARIDVRLSTLADAGDGVVRVEVSDTGDGMDESVRARIFDPFFTTKAPGQSTGLGLSTAYAIVREHGATIRCDSTPGRGTTFTLDFPARGPLVDGSTPAPRLAVRQGRGECVLLVDDERLLRRVLRTLLEHEGYAVREASDGLEALDALTAPDASIDLVLLDHSMPHLSGAETLRRLRARGSRVKVIGYSGLDAPMEGADAMLLKPAMPEALLTAIRTVLDASTAEGT